MRIKKYIYNLFLSPAFFWLIGFISFLWVLIRSGINPKRLTYPCQQAAFPFASAWMIAFAPIFYNLLRFVIKRKTILFTVIGFTILVGFGFKFRNYFKPNKIAITIPVWANENALSDIFVYENIPVSSGSLAVGDASVSELFLSDPAIDSLIYLLNYGENPFFKTTDETSGIVGKNDVVILKCNFQWRHRLGTNTDRIKGVIWQVLNHPDGFKGEILVCDNTESQNGPSSYLAGFNDYSNNSDDEDQSILDVINTFKAKGYPVSYFVWDALNTLDTVSEYKRGDLSDGYIFNPGTLTSYPKFKTEKGNYVSMSMGIWDNILHTYDRDKLTIINFPVLKAHIYAGATIALKNSIGLMNVAKSDDWFGGKNSFHFNYCFSEYALVAKEMELVWPDLNIIDATYVATESNSIYTTEVVNQKTILASTDPVAASWYAAKYILTPLAKYPDRTDPDLKEGKSNQYSTILGYWVNYLKDSTDFIVTKSESEISVYSLNNLPRDITAAIKEIRSEIIKAFPNPFDNRLSITLFEVEKKLASIKIFDLNGNIVFSEKLDDFKKEITIELEHLSSGIYMLEIKTDNNVTYTKKILKK